MGYADVDRDLQGLGYRVAAGLYSAAEVGASHKRERLFIMAYCGELGNAEHAGLHATEKSKGYSARNGSDKTGTNKCREFTRPSNKKLADRDSAGLQTRRFSCGQSEENTMLTNSGFDLFPPTQNDTEGWRNTIAVNPTLEPAVCGMADGMAKRVERLRLCGNGVVPLVAAKSFICLAAKLRIGD
jgi:DNA (cytosine-5)-methyltransferase 1